MRNVHKHPLIYLRGLKLSDLTAIMDFIYLGQSEVNNIYNYLFIKISCRRNLNSKCLDFQVEAANLENFLKAAKDLEIKGLQVRSKYQLTTKYQNVQFKCVDFAGKGDKK